MGLLHSCSGEDVGAGQEMSATNADEKKLTPEVREKLRCGGVNFGAEGLTMKQCCDLMSTLDLALLENKKQPKTKFAVLEALLRLVQKACHLPASNHSLLSRRRTR